MAYSSNRNNYGRGQRGNAEDRSASERLLDYNQGQGRGRGRGANNSVQRGNAEGRGNNAMPRNNTQNRNINGRWRDNDEDRNRTVVTNTMEGCPAPETIAEELYTGYENAIVVQNCCDYQGCHLVDTRRRCQYWPSFAHPRWLTCDQLNNKHDKR